MPPAFQLLLPMVPPAQSGNAALINGAIFAVLAGAVLFAVCRSSSRN